MTEHAAESGVDEPVPALTQRERAAQFEAAQPKWQQSINGLCESWIFAILLAMILRQFFVEAYRIPSASMEPTLYGDTAFMKADHVVVDKLGFRFTGPERWGVTVFQYPIPEVSAANGSPMRAIQPDGSRIDSFPLRPQLQRNFVKRLVGMPGDVFFIRYGNLYLQQADGSFAVAAKPEAVQEALWLPIYEHGADGSYIPWQGVASVVAPFGEGLAFQLHDGNGFWFTQPLVNVYVKPGLVNVQPSVGGSWQQVDVSLLKPTFRYQGKPGSLYDLKNWNINRLTTADLDRKDYGPSLNAVMDEFVGDVRLGFVPSSLAGAPRWELSHGSQNIFSLELTDGAWVLRLDGNEVQRGTQSLINKQVYLALVDNQAKMWIEGKLAADPVGFKAHNPSTPSTRTRIRLLGEGAFTCSSLTLDRDVHYSVDGVLSDERWLWKDRLNAGSNPNKFAKRRYDQYLAIEGRKLFIPAIADAELSARLSRSMQARDRGSYDWLSPLAASPETAVRIPQGGYLFLGDNSPFSSDSRSWGWVPGANLRGQVIFVAFPRMTLVD